MLNLLTGVHMEILEFKLSPITGFELSVCPLWKKNMGILPCKNIFQISFGTLWHGFRLHCCAKLCQEVNTSMPSCTQILRFFFLFLVLYFPLKRRAQPVQITKYITKLPLFHCLSIPSHIRPHLTFFSHLSNSSCACVSHGPTVYVPTQLSQWLNRRLSSGQSTAKEAGYEVW